MKKRLISLLLAFVMVLGLIPAMAPAVNAATMKMYLGSSILYDGQYVLSESTDVKEGPPPSDAQYAYFKDNVLTLKNFNVTGMSSLYDYYIRTNSMNWSICLIGDNSISVNADNFAIYLRADQTLHITGDGTLRLANPISSESNTSLIVDSGNLVMSQGCFIKVSALVMNGGSISMYGQDIDILCDSFTMNNGTIDIDGYFFATCDQFVMNNGTININAKYDDYARDFGAVTFTVSEGAVFKNGTFNITSTHGCFNCNGVVDLSRFSGHIKLSSGFYNPYLVEEDQRTTFRAKQILWPKDRTLNLLVGEKRDGSDAKSISSSSITEKEFGKYHYVECMYTIVPYVIAKSTEPIAGTVNTAPTITIDPECHCKVSDYAEGYWLYYTKGLGWRRMEENTKFESGKDYAYYFAIETTDGYTFPADGGNVNGILQCDQGYFGADVNRVEGRDDVAEMMLYYQPCTYGAPLEFSEQTPVVDFTNSALYEMEAVLGDDYLFSFNNKPLTDEQKAKGFTIERTLMVAVGSLTNFVHKVQNDTGTQPLSYNLTIDQAQTYIVTMAIILKKDGTTLQTKGGVYQIKVVAGGTPVIFTADSANSFGGTITVDIDAMAKKDADLKTALDNGTVKYQWYRGASQIPGADGQSYTFHADDVGKKIKVAVLYGNSGSISEPFEVVGTAPAFTKQPTGGNVAPDKTMTVKWATSFTPTKIVVDKYNFVGLASEYTTLSGTATSTELPANEYGYVIKAYYNDTDFITSNKFTVNEVDFVNPFTDVKEGDFYYDPVMWAVQNGITSGATPTTFNPGGTCLRAQVVTFLHRAAGNPEPTKTSNPFKDVKSTDFFYKPVLWAVEKKITNGTSATTFGSYDTCNRAAVVTFLWRAKGSPEPTSTKNPFVDVKSTDFFYKAVLWAVENGITNGIDATHFGPTTGCNRAQVVTFLYRAYN